MYTYILLNTGRFIDKTINKDSPILLPYQRTNLDVGDTKIICRRQINVGLSDGICPRQSGKLCGKRRNSWYTAFSPFRTLLEK